MEVPSGEHFRHPRLARGFAGFTLIELTVVIVVLGILSSTAIVPFRAWVQATRARSALNTVGAEIYRARAIAVRDGGSASLMVNADSQGCIESLRIMGVEGLAGTAMLEATGICVRHSGDPIMWFNSRGMLRPPTRSFFAIHGTNADSLIVSIAGRVRKSYRRRRCRKNLPGAADSAAPEDAGDGEMPHDRPISGSVRNFPLSARHERATATFGEPQSWVLADRNSCRAGSDRSDHIASRPLDERLRRPYQDTPSTGSDRRGHRLLAASGRGTGSTHRDHHTVPRDLHDQHAQRCGQLGDAEDGRPRRRVSGRVSRRPDQTRVQLAGDAARGAWN